MAKAQSEPTMDEILASIRRIISEEDDEPTTARKPGLEPLQLDDDVAVSDIDFEEEQAAQSAAADPLGEEELTGEEPEDGGQPEENIAMHPAAAAAETEEAEPAQAEATGETQDTTSSFEEEEQVQGTPEFKPTAKTFEEKTFEEVTASAGMISENVTQRASEAFGMLQDSLRISSGNGRTVEDLVEAMLRPMIQDWLEQNLPRIVEEKVEEEVRRIARRR